MRENLAKEIKAIQVKLGNFILICFAVLTTAAAIILFVLTSNDYSANFIAAQALALVGYYLLFYGFIKYHKKEYVMIFFSCFNVFYAVSCFLQGGEAGLWSSVITIFRNALVVTDIFLFKAGKKRLSDASYYTLVAVLFAAPIIMTGFLTHSTSEMLIAVLFAALNTAECALFRYREGGETEVNKHRRILALSNIFLCLLYLVYDILIDLWFAVPLEAAAIFYTVIWWFKKEENREDGEEKTAENI